MRDEAQRIVVVGVGGAGRHALSVLVAALTAAGEGTDRIAGVLDDGPSPLNLARLADTFPEIGYLGTVDAWLARSPEPHAFVVGIGDPTIRRRLTERLIERGHVLRTVVHPRASLGRGVRLGAGAVVSDQAAVDTNVRLGAGVHVGQGAVVGHDCVLADFVSLNPRACLSGEVTVGEQTLVGAGASVRQQVRLGAGATIGMGAVVLRAVPDGATVVGVPARPLGAPSPNPGQLTLGLLTSVGRTLDAFFVEAVARWEAQGVRVVTAAGDASAHFPRQAVIAGLTRRPSPRNAVALAALRRWVRQERVGVVLTNTATASLLVRAAGVAAPVVYFCHGLHWQGTGPRTLPARAAERLALARTAGIICLNAHDETWFRTHAPRTPLVRLEHGVGLDTARFSREERRSWQPGEPLALAWCGELSDRKRPEETVRVLDRLTARGITVELTMIGDGPLRPSLTAAHPGVRWVGHTDPVPYYRAAHVLLQTARWEGLPRVGLEAVALGLPSAGYDVKGVQDLPGVHLAPDGDADALADAVLAAATAGQDGLPDPELLGAERAADQVLAFVREVVG